MKQEELNTLVANEIKKLDLNNTFPEETIKKIEEKVRVKIEEMKSNPETLKEYDNIVEPSLNTSASTASTSNSVSTPSITPEPVINNYVPEMPTFLEKIEPEKFIIFDMNELSIGAEPLSNKEFRLFENPDLKKSIHNTWIQEGKRKADIYIAKFEKVGELEFDYRTGTSKFTDKKDENNVGISVTDPSYTNPYAAPSLPQEEGADKTPEQRALESYIKTSVDLDKAVENYISKLLKDHLKDKNFSVDINQPVVADVDNIDDSTYEYPSDSFIMPENHMKMRELVTNDNLYAKITTPELVKESLKQGGDKAKLIAKSDEVQIWLYEGREYYLPTNIISDKMCYTKKSL